MMFAGRPYGRKSRDMSESNSRRNRTRYDNRDGKGAGFLSLCPYRASVAVAMGGGDGQASLLARAHVNEAIVPPLDDLSELMKKDDLAPSEKSVGTIRANDTYLALAQGEFKGLVAVQARVELAPILVEGARVVHRQLVALLGLDVAFLRAKLYADALVQVHAVALLGRRGQGHKADDGHEEDLAGHSALVLSVMGRGMGRAEASEKTAIDAQTCASR
eukprot:evm.model.NODE_18605_length_9087_cov_23.447233.2